MRSIACAAASGQLWVMEMGPLGGDELNVIAAGDELLGLARGLFRAGAASLLLTLWEVPDQSTCEFMTGFYDRVVAAPNRAAALREATLELRRRHPHPLHWAPFLLMGKVFAS